MLQGMSVFRLVCSVLSPPTGNNLSDSVTLQYLSRSHGLPGKLSAPSSLLQARLASLFGLIFQQAVVSSAPVSTVSRHKLLESSAISLSNYSSPYLAYFERKNSCCGCCCTGRKKVVTQKRS